MTPEKDAILSDCCREWNQLMVAGQRMKYIMRRPVRRQDILFNKLVRSIVKKRNILHWKMARHAGANGLSRNYPYTPNTGFFIPFHLVTTSRLGTGEELIVLRLLPWEELAFYWNSDTHGWGKSWKIHRIKGKWHVSYELPI